MPNGDAELEAKLRALTRRRTRRVAAAVVDTRADPNVRYACIGADLDTRFEIGSITKALTGMLLADAVDRAEMELDTSVGTIVPDRAGVELGSLTMKELCTHTSGLPSIPSSELARLRMASMRLLGRDPYRGTSASELLDLAARQRLRTRGHRSYSNLGGALAGQLLAAAARTEYAALLRERILAPIGMDATAVGNRSVHAPAGRSRSGRREQPWLMDPYAPAGAVVSTITDVSRLAVSLLAGTASGRGSLNPIEGVGTDAPNRKSGMFWIIDTEPVSGRTMIWHNGQTGGYSAFFALFPEAGRAVAVLAAVSNAADQQRVALGMVSRAPVA